MANTLLHPDMITREALRILHQKLTFIGSIDRQHDSSFAQSGAKIGDSLRIRKPPQYTVRTGATIQVQDATETSVTLQLSNQKGVDLSFSSIDLTLDIDDFRSRFLEPAMAVLAANIENDALSMYKSVSQEVSDITSTPTRVTWASFLQTRRRLVESLTPMDGNCHVQLSPTDNAYLADALKALFHDSGEISKQYREGYIGRTAGFQFHENSLMPTHTTGSEAGADTGADVNGASQTGASVTVDGTVTGTFKQGDIVCFAGCNDVHPETKADMGRLKQFVVTSDVAATYSSIPISPSIVTSGGAQNCSASPTDGGIVYKVDTAGTAEPDAAGAVAGSDAYGISLAHHQDAFTFATADLVLPGGVDFASRAVYDGISMRMVRQYDINNDQFPVRIDVLYGYVAQRPELACRIGFN